jgi:hypothetical protein
LKVWIEEGIQQSDGIHTPARVPPFSNGARIMPWNTGEDVGGYTYGAHVIKFSGLSDISDLRRRNHVVHELGHAFKWLLYNKTGIDVYTELGNWRTNHPNYPDRPTFTGSGVGGYYGFASAQNVFTWQQSLSGDDNEEFADQFLGWTFNRWERSPDGQFRSDMMASNMPLWVNQAAGQ